MNNPEYASYQYLYKTKAWHARRRWQLHREPYCRMCMTLQQRQTLATVADHIVPHKGNRQLFWDRNNLQSLCLLHHGEKILQEKGAPVRVAVDADGWPKSVQPFKMKRSCSRAI
jgi:5-methylcytosine-specific restriction enzyme A